MIIQQNHESVSRVPHAVHGLVQVAQVLSSTTPYRDKSPGGEVSVRNLPPGLLVFRLF